MMAAAERGSLNRIKISQHALTPIDSVARNIHQFLENGIFIGGTEHRNCKVWLVSLVASVGDGASLGDDDELRKGH